MNIVGIALGASLGSGAVLLQDNIRAAVMLSRRSWKRLVADDQQLANTITYCSGVVVAVFLVGATMHWSRFSIVVMCALGIGGTILGQRYSQQKLAREQEFELALLTPAWLDVFVLCLLAGLPIRVAAQRSLESAHSLIQTAWRDLNDRTDLPLAGALLEIQRTSTKSSVTRVASTLQLAIERGTPISDVLTAVSHELRSENRRKLLEIAAKKDVTMMLPVVFGILPAVTAVALYPAFITLTNLH